MFPPYKYIITRILRNVNKNIRKIRKNSRDFHTTKLNLPTGALDYKTSKEILKLIETVNEKYGNTIIMVTHNDAIKDMATRVVRLKDGMIRSNVINEKRLHAEELEW